MASSESTASNGDTSCLLPDSSRYPRYSYIFGATPLECVSFLEGGRSVCVRLMGIPFCARSHTVACVHPSPQITLHPRDSSINILLSILVFTVVLRLINVAPVEWSCVFMLVYALQLCNCIRLRIVTSEISDSRRGTEAMPAHGRIGC